MNHFIAVDIGGTSLKSAVVREENGMYTVLPDSMATVPVDSDGNKEQILAAIMAVLDVPLEYCHACGIVPAAIAADTPGPFDFEGLRPLMEHKFKAIYGLELSNVFAGAAARFFPKMRVPIRFCHDSSAFLYGAMTVLPRYTRVAGVMLGTGLGFACAENGVVLENPSGGPRRSIYNLPYKAGIAEDYLSARGVVRRYPCGGLTTRELGMRAESGDEIAAACFEGLGADLAEILAPVLTELGTQALIVGGGIVHNWKYFSGSLKRGLISVPTLRYTAPAENADVCHLLGAVISVRRQLNC